MMIDRFVSVAYWSVRLGWIVIAPICVIGFFAGGWFVAVIYFCAWNWIRDLRTDLRTLQGVGPERPTAAARVDYLLARSDPPPPYVLVQRHGEQDIGNVDGSQDLGYAVRLRQVAVASDLVACRSCFAKYEPPAPTACLYCGSADLHPRTPAP